MTLTFCPLESCGAHSETVPGFNTGRVHDQAISVVFLTTGGACTLCASLDIDAFTVGAGAGELDAAHRHGIAVDQAPITGIGAVELPHWLLEQSVSRTMHRYGRLLIRS